MTESEKINWHSQTPKAPELEAIKPEDTKPEVAKEEASKLEATEGLP